MSEDIVTNNTPAKSPVDLAFEELLAVNKQTSEQRDAIIKKLALTMQATEIDPNFDKGIQIEAKLGIYKTLDDILKSKEASFANAIKLLLQRKDSENVENAQAIVAETLKAVRGVIIKNNTDLHKADTDIANAYDAFKKTDADNASDISPDELTLPDDTVPLV